MPSEFPQEILFARQPIYDRDLSLAGFELLFRDTPGTDRAPAVFDGNLATSRVLVNAFLDSNIDDICSHTRAYVNFTADTLAGEMPFPPERLVIEVLETVAATPEVVAALTDLRRRGYRLALDDYTLTDSSHPLLPYADIVKLEYPQFSEATLTQTVAALKNDRPDLTVLAEKLETRTDFTRAREAGCDLFQGYFLARPEPVPGKVIPVNRLNVIQLLVTVNNSNADIEEIASVIRRDPLLSLRLMKLANSALHRRLATVTSLNMAIMALGTQRVRAIVSLLALAKLHDTPHSLHQLAITRGFVCQALCESLPDGPEIGFTVGLFSCLDALLDQPLEQVLAQVPLDHKITAALLRHEGPAGLVLHAVLELEKASFETIRWSELVNRGIGPAQLMAAFQEGAVQADDSMNSMALSV